MFRSLAWSGMTEHGTARLRQAGLQPIVARRRSSQLKAGNNRAPRAGSPTIKEIATRLGVSHSTVSRALNDHHYTSRRTKEIVHAMAKELGYIANTAARAMRHARSSMVGLIIPDVENDFYAAVAKVTAAQCARENLQLVLAVTEDNAELEYRHVLALREALAAGVIITPSASCQRATLDLLRGMVNIQLLRAHPALDGDFVGLDETGGIFAATQHLIALGHRRLAFIGGPKGLNTTEDRYAGFCRAMVASGLSIDAAPAEFVLPRPAFGEAATKRLLRRKSRPTALIMASPQLTVGALEAIDKAGLVLPQDISLLSYGDTPWFAFWKPGITAVSLPAQDVATTCGSFLFGRMRHTTAEVEESRPSARVALGTHLLVRGSTAAPGKAE
jgi:DNA-binding LacI/PurR family transcriptional regulator